MYSVEIKSKEEMKIIGFVLRTTFLQNLQAEEIPPFFHKVMEAKTLKSVPNRANNNQICVIDRKADSPEFSYYMGVEVNNYDEIPEGMETITIPASNFAVASFTKRGNKDVLMAVKHITEIWIPENEYTEDHQKPGCIYYDESFITGYEGQGYEGNLTAKVFIPVK